MEPMFSNLTDTDDETAAEHLVMLRRAGMERRLALALSLSQSVLSLSRDALARQHPELSTDELAVRFVSRHYGVELADGVRAMLATRRP
jgi:hypothetical protein